MELNEYKKFLHKYFKSHGFEKIKSKYYLNGNGFLCMIHFYRSYYGPVYYFDYYFFLGDFEKPYNINQESVKTYTPFVGSRFFFSEKDNCSCSYLEYSELDLKNYLDKNLSERITPVFEFGKNYLLKHFGTLYSCDFLDEEKIKALLKDKTNE